jgi:tetratricopeptide (TPR) repeat protein
VDPYREPGALWHQTAVRRIMLPDLRATLGDKFRQIHEAAVRYYTGRRSVAERAELVYHHLWLDADAAQLDALWSDDLDAPLRGAFEELDVRGKIWLADKLRIELPQELRAQAEYAVWERQTEQRARTMLAGGLVKEALAAMRERERPPHPSPLYALEADALKLLGHVREARKVIDDGLHAAERAGDRAAMLALLSRDVFLYEATGGLPEALARAERALELARALDDDLEALSCGVACLRIARKLEARGQYQGAGAPSIVALRAQRAAQQGLPRRDDRAREETRGAAGAAGSRPALLQEAAAELGREAVDIPRGRGRRRSASPPPTAWRCCGTRRRGRRSAAKSRRRWRASHAARRRAARATRRRTSSIPFVDFFRGAHAEIGGGCDPADLDPGGGGGSFRPRRDVEPPRRPRSRRARLHGVQPEELEFLVSDEFDTHLRDIAPKARTPAQVATGLLDHAQKHGLLDRLLIALGRSAPPGSEFKDRVRKLFDASGGSTVTL